MLSLPAREAPLVALVFAAILFVACSGVTAKPADTPAPVVAGARQALHLAPTPSATPVPTQSPPPGTIRELAIDVLSREAAEAASVLGRTVSIAVYIPDDRVEYVYNARAPFELRSVVKLPAMLTLLDEAIRDGRSLNADEGALVTAMITESDNEATNVVWDLVGGATGVRQFLDSAGIDGSLINPADWGQSRLTTSDAARLLGLLIDGRILDAASREFAMQLLEHVDPAQDWGVTGAAAFLAETGLKNGWYPEAAGWVLNSLGYVIPNDGASPYVIAVFTNGAFNYYQGIAAIENIASIINGALLQR